MDESLVSIIRWDDASGMHFYSWAWLMCKIPKCTDLTGIVIALPVP